MFCRYEYAFLKIPEVSFGSYEQKFHKNTVLVHIIGINLFLQFKKRNIISQEVWWFFYEHIELWETIFLPFALNKHDRFEQFSADENRKPFLSFENWFVKSINWKILPGYFLFVLTQFFKNKKILVWNENKMNIFTYIFIYSTIFRIKWRKKITPGKCYLGSWQTGSVLLKLIKWYNCFISLSVQIIG